MTKHTGTGEQRRDAGTAQVLANDEPVGYGDLARTVIDGFVTARTEFTAEDVREGVAAVAPDAVPHHPNVLPAVLGTLSRTGVIVPVGMTKATRASRHSGRNLVWRAAA